MAIRKFSLKRKFYAFTCIKCGKTEFTHDKFRIICPSCTKKEIYGIVWES